MLLCELCSEELKDDLWVLTGDPESSADLSGNYPAVWFSYLHLHGILMSVAWGMLFPTGMLIAWCYRHGKSQACNWLLIHVILQSIALVMSCTAFVIVILVSSTPNFPHAIIGIILQISALQQPINVFL